MFKKILNCLLEFFIILVVGTFFLTLFNYFSILGSKIMAVFRLLLPLLAMFVSSYKLGKMSDKKGYLEGLKLGGIIVFIFMVMVFLLDRFDIKCIIYYLILLLTSIMGSMIGSNRKKLDT